MAAMTSSACPGVNRTPSGCTGTDGGSADSAPVHIGRSAVGSRWTVPRGPNVLTRVRSSQSARCTSARVAPAMRRPIESSAALSTWACAPHSTPGDPSRAQVRGRLGQRVPGHPPGRDAAPAHAGRLRRHQGAGTPAAIKPSYRSQRLTTRIPARSYRAVAPVVFSASTLQDHAPDSSRRRRSRTSGPAGPRPGRGPAWRQHPQVVDPAAVVSDVPDEGASGLPVRRRQQPQRRVVRGAPGLLLGPPVVTAPA